MKKVLIIVLILSSFINSNAQNTISFLNTFPKPGVNITDPELLYHYILYNKENQNYNECLRASSKFILLFVNHKYYNTVRCLIPEALALDGDVHEAIRQLDIIKKNGIIKEDIKYQIQKSNIYFIDYDLTSLSNLWDKTEVNEIGVDLFFLYILYGKYKNAKKLCEKLNLSDETERDLLYRIEQFQKRKKWNRINILDLFGVKRQNIVKSENLEKSGSILYQSMFFGIQGFYIQNGGISSGDYIFMGSQMSILLFWRYTTKNTNFYKIINENYMSFCAEFSREKLRFLNKF